MQAPPKFQQIAEILCSYHTQFFAKSQAKRKKSRLRPRKPAEKSAPIFTGALFLFGPRADLTHQPCRILGSEQPSNLCKEVSHALESSFSRQR